MAIIDVGARVKFDSSIFTTGFPEGCNCGKCHSSCCEAGAMISIAERNAIVGIANELVPLVTEENKNPANWFSAPDAEDFARVGEMPTKDDLENTVCTGTGTGFCKLFNPEFGCAIQERNRLKGLPKWTSKPDACVLYPLYWGDDEVIKPDVNLDDGMWCSDPKNHVSTVFRACLGEIEHIAGKEAVEKLKAIEHQYFKNKEIAVEKGARLPTV